LLGAPVDCDPAGTVTGTVVVEITGKPAVGPETGASVGAEIPLALLVLPRFRSTAFALTSVEL